MAATTITDSGASITITVGTQMPRNILKAKITEITIIKTNILKIDIGKGTLDNIFIPHADVTAPARATPSLLKDTVNQMLNSALATVPLATAAKQDSEITLLSQIYGLTTIIKDAVVSLENKIFYQPLLIDDGGAGLLYKGYAMPGSSQEMAVWAIEKIQKVGSVDVHTWANGNRDFDKKWIERETQGYF